MNELDLLLKILQGANIATPGIVAVIGSIKQGRAAGKSDDEIEADSMAIALQTRERTDIDMGDQA